MPKTWDELRALFAGLHRASLAHPAAARMRRRPPGVSAAPEGRRSEPRRRRDQVDKAEEPARVANWRKVPLCCCHRRASLQNRRACAESLATWVLAPRRPSWSRACASSSTAATTRRGSPSTTARPSRSCARSASSRSSTTRSPSAPCRARPASATRAGRRTAGPASTTPIRTSAGDVAVVHNGIIENHVALRARARSATACASRPTPTPRSSRTWSIARSQRWSADPLRSGAQGARTRCDGAYAIAVVSRAAPDRARRRQERLAARARASATARRSAAATSPRSSRTRAT